MTTYTVLTTFPENRSSANVGDQLIEVAINTLGGGGFDRFVRKGPGLARSPKEGGTSGYCVTAEEFAAAPARPDLVPALRQFLREECDTGFRRYLGVANLIDETYEKVMAPFLRSLPD